MYVELCVKFMFNTYLWNQKLQPDSHNTAWSLSWTSLWQLPHGYIGGAFGFCGLNTIGWSWGYICNNIIIFILKIKLGTFVTFLLNQNVFILNV